MSDLRSKLFTELLEEWMDTPDSSSKVAIREAFEVWYKLVYWDFDRRFCSYDPDADKYDHLDVDLAYSAFKAAVAWVEARG